MRNLWIYKVNCKWIIMGLFVFAIIFAVAIKSIYQVNLNNEWVGFLGNYTGGILGSVIGAIVAYCIASEQFRLLREQEDQKVKLKQDLSVAKIYIEIDKIIKGLQEIMSYQKFSKENGRGFDEYIEKRIEIPETNENYWIAVDNILDIQLQINLLKTKQEYDSIQKAISFDLEPLKKKLDKFSERINDLNKSSSADQLILRLDIELEKMDIDLEYDQAKDKKLNVYAELDKTYEKVIYLKTKIEKIIQ